tara:strand:- start:5999 stop:7801 length:1803 start_codon:yes stop_codon:yes gene_type:complete
MANRPEINYLSRDFESIKKSLVEYAKRFYPEKFNDFTEASFGSFLLDTVAYIGDIASFQLDYQSNENMLNSAINRENIIRIAKQMGFNSPLSPNVTGFVSLYVNVPSNSDNTGPDVNYLPVIKEGTSFSSVGGAVFVLTEDVDFSQIDTEFVVSTVNSLTGVPSKYAAKRNAPVASGLLTTTTNVVEDRSSNNGFLKVDLNNDNIVEVISVIDLEGNSYYQVDSLTQDVVYKPYINDNTTSSNTLKVLKPLVAARRFVVEFNDDTVSLIFGNGKEDAGSALSSINDPTKVVLQKYGKDYVSSTILDPTVLNSNDRFGIGPSNTTLTITYRYNTTSLLSAGAKSITQVDSVQIVFPTTATVQLTKDEITTSVEVENDERIAGSRVTLSNEEIKHAAASSFASQNRIVTVQDYEAFCYRMPAEFGTIARATAQRDDFSPRRALNLYVLGQDDTGALATASQAVKDNLKVWISRHKTMSDSVDILNGRMVNFGLRFSFVSNPNFSLLDARKAAEDRIRFYFNRRKYYFGESISLTAITKLVNDLEQVDDVLMMEPYSVTGGVYSDIEYDFIKNRTTDGRFVKIPSDYIFEIKNYSANITGEAI